MGSNVQSSRQGAAPFPAPNDLTRLEHALRAELERLSSEFDPVLPHDTVCAEFDACRSSFEDARIRMYVPVLVYRNARQALRQRALTNRRDAS